MKQVKVGPHYFNAEAVKKMSFREFSSIYKDKLRGATLEEAYAACGGKIKAKKSTEETDEAEK